MQGQLLNVTLLLREQSSHHLGLAKIEFEILQEEVLDAEVLLESLDECN